MSVSSTEPKPEARRGAPAADDIERRVVTFTDGPSPRLSSSGDRDIQGLLELEVRFKNPNPLCYRYSTNIGAGRVAASDLALPVRAPAIGAFGALPAVQLTTLEEAVSAITAAENEVDEIYHSARYEISLDDVWAECDAGGDFAVQRQRVEQAARAAAAKLGSGGAFRQALERAEATALGAKRLARELEGRQHEAVQELESRKAALSDAEKREREVAQRVPRAGATRKLQEQADEAARELASAQRQLREAELEVGKHRRASDLTRSAERLEEQVRRATEELGKMAAELNRARSLLAQSPTAIRRRFASGESVRVVVERTRLERGVLVAGREPQRFEAPAMKTLRPILLDIGLGPALSLGANTERYETVWSPRPPEETESAWRIVRTEQGLDLDLIVSISIYLWKRRYLDEGVFDAWQLIPRPMVGISLDRPFDAIYAGAQIDPIQFLNIGGGVRFATTPELVGPQPLDRALIDDTGEPQPPVVRNEVKATGFISLTVSTNLIYRWIKQGL